MRIWIAALLAPAWLAAACDAAPPPAPSDPTAPSRPAPAAATRPDPGPASVRAEVAGETFHFELAADDATRMRGLGGRRHVPANSGMLFSFRLAAPRVFVMRDCPIPLDIAFLDEAGRVIAIHAMQAEAPRGPEETPLAYEQRLVQYPSGAPAQFAIETAGGRLAELGLGVGDVVTFDRAAVLARTE